MSKEFSKIELPITILIIVFSVFISEFLIHKYVFSEPFQAASVKTGNNQLNIPDIDWTEKDKTLILALQSSCGYCNESAPFYKRLIESVKGKKIKLIAVLPDNVEASRDHLNKLGLNDLDVRQASLESLPVNGTPTLMLVDNNGQITNSWIGKLSTNKEIEVLKKLFSDV